MSDCDERYVQCLLERIADLQAHIKDLREVCELGAYDVKPKAGPEILVKHNLGPLVDFGLATDGRPTKHGEKGHG